MKLYYVYELVNLLGTVEHVGHTENPERRFQQHTKRKQGRHGHGKFNKRQDLTMHVVSSYPTKKEAYRAEMILQKFWGFETEDEKTSNAQKNIKRPYTQGIKNGSNKLTEKDVKEIKLLLKQNISSSKIAKKFKVTRQNIGLIKREKAWKHITI